MLPLSAGLFDRRSYLSAAQSFLSSYPQSVSVGAVVFIALFKELGDYISLWPFCPCSPSFKDILWDFVGIALGVVLTSAFVLAVSRFRRPHSGDHAHTPYASLSPPPPPPVVVVVPS